MKTPALQDPGLFASEKNGNKERGTKKKRQNASSNSLASPVLPVPTVLEFIVSR